MQLFLANSYFVCQMYMNGAINEEQVLLYQIKVFNAAASLIEKELQQLYSAPEAEGVAGRFTPLDVNKLVEKILELEDDKQAPPEQEKSGNNDSGTGNNETSDDEQKPPSP